MAHPFAHFAFCERAGMFIASLFSLTSCLNQIQKNLSVLLTSCCGGLTKPARAPQARKEFISAGDVGGNLCA